MVEKVTSASEELVHMVEDLVEEATSNIQGVKEQEAVDDLGQ